MKKKIAKGSQDQSPECRLVVQMKEGGSDSTGDALVSNWTEKG